MPSYRVKFQGLFLDRHSEQLHNAGITYEGHSTLPQDNGVASGGTAHRAIVDAPSSEVALGGPSETTSETLALARRVALRSSPTT